MFQLEKQNLNTNIRALGNEIRVARLNNAITEFFIYKANSISEAILVHNLHNCGFNFSCISNFA